MAVSHLKFQATYRPNKTKKNKLSVTVKKQSSILQRKQSTQVCWLIILRFVVLQGMDIAFSSKKSVNQM